MQRMKILIGVLSSCLCHNDEVHFESFFCFASFQHKLFAKPKEANVVHTKLIVLRNNAVCFMTLELRK